jgi:flavin reductase (DIM6/NTAB) family NADH-FMN oxidoreductase RutF
VELQSLALDRCYRLLNHGPTILVSTSDGRAPNACPIAWCMPIDFDPARFALVISDAHKTYENLQLVPECVLNLPTVEALREVMICGNESGRGGDKLARAGIAHHPSTLVRPPRLDCCVAWIEARVVALPAAEQDFAVVVEVLVAECRPGAMTPEGFLDVEKVRTLHHLGGNRFALPGATVTGVTPE